MLRTLYSRFLLLIMPSVDGFILLLEKGLGHLETLALALENRVEANVVAIGQNTQAELRAIEAITEHYKAKNDAAIERITADRAEIRKAREARAAVANLIRG